MIPKPPAVSLPTLVPIVFMMGGSPNIGRSRSYGIYEPMGDSVARVTLRVAAESLFTVSDSATYDSTAQRWSSAHTDTVRSWSSRCAAILGLYGLGGRARTRRERHWPCGATPWCRTVRMKRPSRTGIQDINDRPSWTH